MRARWLLPPVMALVAGPLAAEAPERSPRPEVRPVLAVAAPALAPEAPVSDAAPQRSPRPMPRQQDFVPAVAPEAEVAMGGVALTALQRPPEGSRSARRRQAEDEPPQSMKGAVCGDPGIRGTVIAPIRAEAMGCGLDEGVAITAIDNIGLSMTATIDCTTASALAHWVRDAAVPAVGDAGGGLQQLQVAAHYACRPRNNQAGARMSEHGKGHAIDISGLVLANGTVITVLEGWGQKRAGRILRALHKAACGPFGTVLGPDSDRHHQDHLHFDTARYRKGSYCR